MGVRHIALFKFAEGTSEEDIAGISRTLQALPGQIPALRNYTAGPDLGLSDGTWDYAVVADVDDLPSFEAYRDHPEHRRVVTDVIGPCIVDRASTQVVT